MSRRLRLTLYAAAFVVPPALVGAIRMRELETRGRPALLPRLAAESTALVAPPSHDPAKPTVVVLFGADVTEITDALGPYEMFARAGTFNVYAVAPERQPTLLSGGLRILPHFSLAGLDERLAGQPPAVVVVPNIPNIDRVENRPLLAWMRRQAAAGALMHSWCTGAMALAEAGLLDGRTATAHWGDLARLAERYPRVRWVRGVRWVDHGTLITSAGLTSGIDASLRVLARLAGDSVARRVAAELRYPNFRFAYEPVAPQYDVRPADAVLLANAAFRVARPQLGIALYDGVGEFDVSHLYDTHAFSAVAEVHSVAATAGVVRTEHGLTLLPSLSAAPASPDGAAIRGLDRLVVPGRDGRARAARLVAAVRAMDQALKPAYLHEDAAERFGLEPVLEDLARAADEPTARFALRRLEYRSDSVRFEGTAFPWGLLPLPLALGATGLVLARGVGRRASRRRLAAAAVALLAGVTPSALEAQTYDAVAPDARLRVDILAADSARSTPLARLARFARYGCGGDRAQPVIGTLVAVTGDAVLVTVRAGADPVRLPRTAIGGVYVSGGWPPRWEAAARGAVAPALLGAALGALSSAIRHEQGDPGLGQAAASSAAWGALSGAVRGAWSPRERWRPVRLPPSAPMGEHAVAGERAPEPRGERTRR